MQKPNQIESEVGQLIQLANMFEKEGNYQYSLPCYKRIIQLLQGKLLSTSDYSSQYVLKENIQQYQKALKRATEIAQSKKLKQMEKKDIIKKQKSLEKEKNVSNDNNNKGKNISGSFSDRKLIQKPININMPIIKQQKKPVGNNNSVKIGSNPPPKNNQFKQPPMNYGGNNKKPVGKPVSGKINYPPKKKPIDPDIQNMIIRDIKLTFKDIVGMKQVKSVVQQAVIRPRKRPDLYQGIRAPPRGILFYGPPGNGKTYIAKALANQSKCTFFAVSASSIMTKWIGDSQKMLRKLFETAKQQSPSIIFIDQIDSLLTARSQKQNQVSRRVKTQFLVMMDGMMSAKQGDILLIGATNLPTELDLAVLRRFNKLIYVGLPDPQARSGIVLHNLKSLAHQLQQKDIQVLKQMLEGYSASQIKDICKQVSMMPLRQLSMSMFQKVKKDSLRPITLNDFQKVLSKKKPLLSKQDLKKFDGNFEQH